MTLATSGPHHTERLRAFLNTLDVEEETDALADAATTTTWLHAQGLLQADHEVDRAQAALVRELRDALRASVEARHDERSLDDDARRAADRVAAAAPLTVRLGPDGTPDLVPAGDGVEAAVGQLLVDLHLASGDGTLERLKICPRDNCRWAFYDASRNRSGRWCSMAVCGNRSKVERFRDRHAGS